MKGYFGTSILLTLSITALVTLSDCSQGGNSAGGSLPGLGEVSNIRGITSFRQNIPVTPGKGGYYGEIFPGQANHWDINSAFALEDGYGDQVDKALLVKGLSNSFPSDQDYSEVTFYTPVLGENDGIVIAAVADSTYDSDYGYGPISGTYSAFLNDTSDSRLMQTLDLSAAVGTVTLTCTHNFDIGFLDISGENSYFRVLLRSPVTSGVLETIYIKSGKVGDTKTGVADITSYSGSRVVLSIEVRSGFEYNSIIDDVSVTDSSSSPVEFVINGDFETGDLTGWMTNDPQEIQNMTSGARTVDGLTVTRSFYTVPNNLWGRWVDVFANSSGSAIATTIEYETNLGSDGWGIIYQTPNTGGTAYTTWDGARALTSWDGWGGGGFMDSDRDVGFVFGTADRVEFLSDDGFNNGNGSDVISFYYRIYVPHGAKVAIVNFIVMSGESNEATALSFSDKASTIDSEIQNIVNTFWDNDKYRRGMTQEQIESIVNF
jgi:hypothetical protein